MGHTLTDMNESPLTTIFLPVALGVIMLGLGLSLTWADFRRVVSFPKAAVTGLVAQMVFLPLVGWGLVHLFSMSAELAVGLMVLALCPGGPTATLITHLSKGDTALSVTLTAVTSVLTVVTVPLVLNPVMADLMGAGRAVSLPVLQTVGQLFLITLLPVGLGMLIRSKRAEFADRMERPVKVASAVLLVLVIAGAILRERENLPTFFAQAGLPMLVLNLVAIGLGLGAGWLLKLNREESVCLAVDTSISNGTLAIFITATLLGSPQMAIPAAIYSLLMFATGVGIIGWSGARNRATAGGSRAGA